MFCNVTLVLAQNVVFDIAVAGKKNAAFILIIGALKYKMRACFCFQTTGAKWIESNLKWVFKFMITKMAKVQS